jgi:hypothetical protein
MGKTSNKPKKSDLDQFYTSPDVAQLCWNELMQYACVDCFDWFIEPSAGTGNFLRLMPIDKRIGVDIDPKLDEIVRQDFFEFTPPPNARIAMVGNPPFGKIASLAVRFFNAAANYSDVIAFIVPKTFKKASCQNKLSLDHHLITSIDLPKNSFVLNDEPYDVPCCFQIWSKRRLIRNVDLTNAVFDFVGKKDGDVAVRRVGGRSGKATSDVSNTSESSHYYLRLLQPNQSKFDLIEAINQVSFSDVINSTAGVRSLSKPELLDKMRKAKIV